MTIDGSAVGVLGRGGDMRPGGRPGRGCLTQRGQLERRIYGAPHQVAERALRRATGDRRGEHVFGKLRVGSDGNGRLQGVLQPRPATPHGCLDDRKAVGRRPLPSPAVGRSHTHQLRVRYGECDPQGVVFNAHYFAYFDIALTELWRDAVGSYAAMMDQGVDLQVVEATARYRAPARFDDLVDVTIEVTRLGTTSMVTSLEIRRGDALLVEGELAHVFVDRDSLTKIPIPDAIRAALEV